MHDFRLLIDREVPIPMRDGTVLRADVYRPESGRWPTLVHRTPYGKSPYPENFVSLDPVFTTKQGYAVVVQDTRGRGESEGEFLPFDEIEDGFDTVQWAAQQPWSNGRVGIYGSSYMGGTSLQAAIAAPSPLVTFVTAQASDDYYEGRTYWGGALEFGSLISTSLGSMAGGSMLRLQESVDLRALRGDIRRILDGLDQRPVTFPLCERIEGLSAPLRTLTPWFYDWVAHDERDEYWKKLSLQDRYGSVETPGLHITSWYDAMHVGALRNFTGVTTADGGRRARMHRLVVGPWHHYALRGYAIDRVRVGELSFGAGSAMNLDTVQLQWFGSLLAEGGEIPGRFAPVRIFVMGSNVWRDEHEWPLARATDRAAYLSSSGRAAVDSSDGRLIWKAASRSAADEYDYDPRDPVPTAGGVHLMLNSIAAHGPVEQSAVEARPDVAVYTSDVLDADLEVTGYVDVEIWLTSSAPTTDVTARLVDVYPDGRAYGICDGIRRLPVEPGADATTVRRAAISLGATSQVFKAGHRLRVDISSSNFPRFDPNPNNGQRSLDATSCEVAHQRILHGPDWPSRIVLPIVDRPAPSDAPKQH